MNQIFRSLICMMLLSCVTLAASAQQTPEMADAMRSNGKIYVVVAVCLAILIGLFLYMVRIDRKVSRMEKQQHNH